MHRFYFSLEYNQNFITNSWFSCLMFQVLTQWQYRWESKVAPYLLKSLWYCPFIGLENVLKPALLLVCILFIHYKGPCIYSRISLTLAFPFTQTMWLGSSEHSNFQMSLLGHWLIDAVQPGVMNKECGPCTWSVHKWLLWQWFFLQNWSALKHLWFFLLCSVPRSTAFYSQVGAVGL